jgi:hypothetical protein
MDMNLSLDLLLYGVMLIGFSELALHQVPDLVGVMPIAGLVGGVLSLFWGVRGLLGFRGSAGATVTLAVLAVVLLALAVNAWLGVGAGVEISKLVATILTVLVVFAVGQLANFTRSGRRPPPNPETNDAGAASERVPSHDIDE